jgi:outer membrane protein assembly factor BamB
LTNNNGQINFDSDLKESKKYKFSKIKNFYQVESEISFHEDNFIFFDNKGSLMNFNIDSKLIWKKNYYTKSEKKLNPKLQFINLNKFLFVSDNISKYYLIDIDSGNLIWSKNSIAPFNSQIKIYKDKIFVVDYSNTLRCFSLKDGSELWNIKTQNSLIRTQKKLSLVISKNIIFFNNSVGDITAVDLTTGQLLWQLPTQNNLIYQSSFSLETSEIVTDNENLFFSNNRNQLFSIDIETGSFNWETKINSSLKSTIIGDFLFSISNEGYLFLVNKNDGKIMRITDIFSSLKPKEKNIIKPTGFIIGLDKIYVSTNNGKLFIVDIESGKTSSFIKIDNKKILRPSVYNGSLFTAKDNAIIKLN